ncbi:DNA cytosine methyltransferase [Paraburkholderia sp. J10-1]|uniref:DNA cytosine methyltransferase n=1 Tax=Paraburkholderia sp. J10-1 TaxID=2805430 RepID=UPI002AB78638|nr:DNA cytosine methyltransferase [Paraburkholderia sp. J10-1]
MIYGSVCSGIEAASVAWHPLGWRAAWFSEIEPFPCALLAHHYPTVPNLGDMTNFKVWPDAAIDLLVGGTPCQSFSVAGLRKGLADPRGNLMLTYLAIAARYRPRWLVWENVPGVLSADGGRAFGTLLGGLAELGYGFAYRILDAQYFGVAQRRRRVFVVGHLGDWRRAAAVLFERESLLGNPAPSREAGKGIAPTLSARTKGGGGLGTDFECDGGLIPGVARALTTSNQRIDAETETLLVAHLLRGEGFDTTEDGTGRGTPLVPVVAPTLRAGGNATGGARPYGTDVDTCDSVVPVAFDLQQITSKANRSRVDAALPAPTMAKQIQMHAITFQSSQSGVRLGDTHATLDANNGPRRHNGVMVGSAVRRLTPRECERLQGFPDDYTRITLRGKPAADGPRYKALGNSMAIPPMRWIGERIQTVDELIASLGAYVPTSGFLSKEELR